MFMYILPSEQLNAKVKSIWCLSQEISMDIKELFINIEKGVD